MKSSEEITSAKKPMTSWLAPLGAAFGENKVVQVLGSLLVLQLLIAFGLLWRSSSKTDFAPVSQLVSVEPGVVNGVVIDDGEERVALTYADDQWRLDDRHNTLASADKVNQLIADVAALKPGLPVASSSASHQQLDVSENQFQRRVTFKSGTEAVVDIYMGTSPGFRKSHVRLVDQDPVYAAKLNTFDVPAEPEEWLEKNLLSFESVSGIQSSDIELSLEGDQWAIVSPQDRSETHEVDDQEMTAVLSQLSSLRVTGFAEPLDADQPADNASSDKSLDELLTHTLTLVEDDTPVTLTLSRKGSDITVERSDVQGLFALPIAAYEALTDDAIEKLIVEKSADSSTESDTPQG